MDELQQVHDISMLQWLLAYAGAFIYVMIKIQEISNIKGYQVGTYVKRHWASTVATLVMIPVCMLILNENLTDRLPINNLTSVLVGYQTNQVFRSMMSIGGKKFNIKTEENQTINKESNENENIN